MELRALVDLGDALDRRIDTYSGGMHRRLDLAAALVHNPEVLFLDEPTTGLDPISRASVWQEVQRLNDELGMTILLTTQYLEEADELADRVGIVDNGRLVAEGTPTELKRIVGTDVVIARIEGDTAAAVQRARRRATASSAVEGHDHELTISVDDGSPAIGPIAIALHDARIQVHDLTLRTPTLDDVFLELTGAHFDDTDDRRTRGGVRMTAPTAPAHLRPPPASPARSSAPGPPARSTTWSRSPGARCARCRATSRRSSRRCSSRSSSSS